MMKPPVMLVPLLEFDMGEQSMTVCAGSSPGMEIAP